MVKKWSVPISVLVSQTSFHGGTSGDYYQEIMTLNVNENNVKKTFCFTTDQKFICDTFICLSMSLTKPSCFKNRNPFSSNSAYDTITYGLLKARLLESEKRHKCELITLLTPMCFYLISPSTFTYLVSDRVLSRIGKLFSLDHGAWYFCL